MAKTLTQFAITPTGNGDYLLNLEDEDGESTEMVASYEQLDLIVEAVQEQLDADEEDALLVDEDGESDDLAE
ncbi:hypothetical protein [Sphingomonas turrisvirgatae]|uniref:Uncharacterized protein n=1 Tax=Sphingomonas turrisvirgatae TaxID=1888892 RepID=A0A1E3M038_9SPHN|nr:hypothetical protein [Sphingomonas turrisvirgatae]ODP38705.1 hypothetical protein BFL28_01360 [Sphingomonas turrisvirgatae]